MTTGDDARADRLAAQVTARIRHLLDTCPACAERAERTPPAPKYLTYRHVEVLQMTADGLTAAAIGERLGLSEKTIRSHLYNAARALGATTGTHAVALAIRAGVVE